MNRRHADFQSAALPTELSGRRVGHQRLMRGGFGCPEERRKKSLRRLGVPAASGSCLRHHRGVSGAWRAVRCRACRYGCSSGVATMAAAWFLVIGAVPGGRVLPCGRVLVPPVMNHDRRCRTMGFAVPVAAMLPVVQKPSAPGRCNPHQAAKAGRPRDLWGASCRSWHGPWRRGSRCAWSGLR